MRPLPRTLLDERRRPRNLPMRRKRWRLSQRARMKLLEHRAVVEWHDGHPLCIYFLDDVPNPELALRMFRIRQARNALVGVTVDLRGSGWCMFRFDDRNGVDFRKVTGDPEVAFIHGTGFLATTKTRCPTDTLRALVRRAAGVEGT